MIDTPIDQKARMRLHHEPETTAKALFERARRLDQVAGFGYEMADFLTDLVPFLDALSRRVPASGELDVSATREAMAEAIVAKASGSVDYWDGDPNLWVTLKADIIAALSAPEEKTKLGRQRVTCSTCGGVGFLDAPSGKMTNCPECDGSGYALASLPLPVAGTPEGWRMRTAIDAFTKLNAGLKLAAIGGPATGPGSARRQLAKTLLPFLGPIEAALAAPPAPEGKAELVSDDKVDAERWRALMSSPKMHWMGSAGFTHVLRPDAPAGSRALEDQDPVPRAGDPWHFGMEFWFGVEADPQYPDTFERRYMVAYVDAIRALSTPPGAP